MSEADPEWSPLPVLDAMQNCGRGQVWIQGFKYNTLKHERVLALLQHRVLDMQQSFGHAFKFLPGCHFNKHLWQQPTKYPGFRSKITVRLSRSYYWACSLQSFQCVLELPYSPITSTAMPVSGTVDSHVIVTHHMEWCHTVRDLWPLMTSCLP